VIFGPPPLPPENPPVGNFSVPALFALDATRFADATKRSRRGQGFFAGRAVVLGSGVFRPTAVLRWCPLDGIKA